MFTVEEIKEAAVATSGLSDFGSTEFEEPLAILVKAYNEEAQLSEIGEPAIRGELIGDLAGRLRVIEGLKRAPQALEENIEKPVFILGFPRTGTTTLHNMIQANPDCQVLEHWLGLYPKSRPPRAQWESDPDYMTVADALRRQYEANPDLRAQHDISADSADECRFLFKHLLMDDGYGYLCDLPSYWAWFDAQSMAPAYRWHRNALKLIQYPHDTKRRWVLKYPTHMAWIEELFEVYPDACIIQTHRDPAATIPSFRHHRTGNHDRLSTADRSGRGDFFDGV
ncbi:MAG: sulfotransferase, partial [Novosphingobium sp.]|nr:sulfotransferase [Novosphingobium sp.]